MNSTVNHAGNINSVGKKTKTKKLLSKASSNHSNFPNLSTLYKEKISPRAPVDKEASKDKELSIVEEHVLTTEEGSSILKEVDILSPDELKYWTRLTGHSEEDCRRAVNMAGHKPKDLEDAFNILAIWVDHMIREVDRILAKEYENW